MMQEAIEECCKQLRIGSTFYKGYKDIQGRTNEEFLLKLLQMEVINREILRKKRLLKNAEFDVMKTFQNYSFDNIEIPKTISIESIQTARFIKDKENLILYGSVGTGKTHMAIATGIEACNQGKQVKFIRTIMCTLVKTRKSNFLVMNSFREF